MKCKTEPVLLFLAQADLIGQKERDKNDKSLPSIKSKTESFQNHKCIQSRSQTTGFKKKSKCTKPISSFRNSLWVFPIRTARLSNPSACQKTLARGA